VFGSRVDEYEQNGRLVLRDLVRASIRNRNNRFGAPRFGGWKPDEVLKGAAQMLGLDQARQSLQGIKAFAEDHRDAGGITGNIFRIINITNNVDFMEPVTMSTTTNTFSGTFTGSNLNVSSTLSNVSQNIGLLPNADQGTKEALTKLLGELHAELDKLSASKPERKQQVEDVAAATDDLFEKAKQEKPNPTLLQRALDGVKTVAKTLEDIAPSVLSTVTTIVGIVAKLHGL